MRLISTLMTVLVIVMISCTTSESASDGFKLRGNLNAMVTTGERPWRNLKAVTLSTDTPGNGDIVIDISQTAQEITGFGGAVNEKGWEAMKILSPEGRTEVIRALYGSDGARFNTIRMPIGSSDYALSRYTYSETPEDFGMEHFSIDRDTENLVPYIKAILDVAPGSMLWGSPWTPPAWMKTNGAYDSGWMKDDPAVYEAYALYFTKYVESYRNLGLTVDGIAVQNEPYIETNYPSCRWKYEQFITFIRDYLDPTLREHGLATKIWLGTFNEGQWDTYPRLILDEIAPLVYGIGYQWDGLKVVARTRQAYPDMPIMQTETECGNWSWIKNQPGFTYDPVKAQNDWYYGNYTWGKIREYLTSGVNSYMLWNMVLDEYGLSIDSKAPWPQNAAIVIDQATKSIVYTPMYYAIRHFSAYADVGAKVLKVGGFFKDVMAFLNPDGSVAVVLRNIRDEEATLSLSVGSSSLTVQAPANSFVSFRLPPGSF